ncbi:MAG: alpha-amylase [Verrucomicrobia bacterium]|nr:alpha-amylase [Cytophagales bacterium]
MAFYDHTLHQQINSLLKQTQTDLAGKDNPFYARLLTTAPEIKQLYNEIYGHLPQAKLVFEEILKTINQAYTQRPNILRQKDADKLSQGQWFLSNELAGMSLYVDRFAGSLKNLAEKTAYFKFLGINVLHLMPVFESPAGESDGGYAVSDFRKVDERFGTLADLQKLQQQMQQASMFFMIDIVLNHTSHRHAWAEKAKNGEKKYQDYFYMFDDRTLPDAFEQSLPEIFPEAAPGSFTYVPECEKWVMTVFHNYQWDLNYANPAVFVEMLDTIFFYANLGVDILRIDAPAFIWKQLGTSCQNLRQAHTLLQLIKQCVQVAAPGMALLGEAIVAPKEIMKYFGTGNYQAQECDFAYNATQMALQWDALATSDTRVMLASQPTLLQKPFGTSWITYTRCHDDIGLAYEDESIMQAGFSPYQHRSFLKDYYSGVYENSPSKGALFSVNPKTQDARISGTLAALCGLEKALEEKNEVATEIAIKKILLMQAMSFFVGGLPMLFYGDEVGYTNDYSYLKDSGKSYDNRWLHRPVIDWKKNERINVKGTVENRIFESTRQLLALRKKLSAFADYKNLTWLASHNRHIAGFKRTCETQNLYCIFNFNSQLAYLTWFAFKEQGLEVGEIFHDHWQQKDFIIGNDDEYLILEPYTFCVLEIKE